MASRKTRSIAVVGAGPKAAAIVARAAVMRQIGLPEVPEILVFDRSGPAAAWDGAGNYTSGFLTLCTPGEKDVGFPYQEIRPSLPGHPMISRELMAGFSWAAFLVATGRFGEWVDRGRDHPSHAVFAAYIRWVFETAGQTIKRASVTRVRTQAGPGWLVETDDGKGGSDRYAVDGVVLTGTGTARRIATAGYMPPHHVLDAETFWPAREQVASLTEGTIVVAGDGGAAGAITAWLAQRLLERDVRIISVSPSGTLFPRGDGYSERRWFSDPSAWRDLREKDRLDILDRTEAGVVSARLKTTIDHAENVDYLPGKIVKAAWERSELVLQSVYDGRSTEIRGDYLVAAIGFDRWTLLGIVDHPRVRALRDPTAERLRRSVERNMTAALCLPLGRRWLHVPALTGLAQGPGMGNLGCLGHMAETILHPYVS